MQTRARIAIAVILLAGTVAQGPSLSASHTPDAAPMTFVGSTPCGEAMRGFLGGLAPDATCHAITWDLKLQPNPSGASSWSLTAKYSVPPPGNPNAMMDGPVVSRTGVLEVATAPVLRPDGVRYRLRSAAPSETLSLTRISEDVVHFLTPDGKLLLGTAGWSYSLNAIERAEPPIPPSSGESVSYTISPKATGDGVFALLEGRTPCTRIATELGMTPGPGCLKVKWRVTLFQDPVSKNPTTFKIEGSLDRGRPHQGTWRITEGTAGDPRGVVYELRSSDRRPMLLLRASDDVLFMLDSRKIPLVGNRDFSYTLNRVPAVR